MCTIHFFFFLGIWGAKLSWTYNKAPLSRIKTTIYVSNVVNNKSKLLTLRHYNFISKCKIIKKIEKNHFVFVLIT